MILIFNKFDLNRAASGKDADDVTIHDVVVDSTKYGQTSLFHRASVIMYHDVLTGNFKVLKHRHLGKYQSGIINKYNKGVLVDLILSDV